MASDGSLYSAGGRIFINGQEMTGFNSSATPRVELVLDATENSKPSIEVHGASSVAVYGNAGSVVTTSAAVTVTNGVEGNVRTVSGSVRSGGSIGGSVSTISGSINASGGISGNVTSVSGRISKR
jgi:hypothetical protein